MKTIMVTAGMTSRVLYSLGIAILLVWSAPEPASAQDPIPSATWYGATLCGSEPVYVSLSTELAGELDHPLGPAHSAIRIQMADTPGGPPWARGYGNIRPQGSGVYGLNVLAWSFRPLDLAKRIGQDGFGAYVKPESSEGQERLVVAPSGTCEELILAQLSQESATSGITMAKDLPRTYQGTLGCYGVNNGNSLRNQNSAIRLSLTPIDETTVEGQMEITRNDGNPQNEVGTFDVFGEFDPALGRLTLISGQWISAKPTNRLSMFDFSAELKDRGNRLIGRSSLSHCGFVEMTVPGTDYLAQIVRPLAPGPVSQWNWASDCLTLINWAYQAVAETGKHDFTTLGAVEGPRVAIGLFADERFSPYFGKPFADLTSEERARIVDLARSCGFQQAFGQAMGQSGAHYHVQNYFWDERSGEWMKLKRFRLLRARLSREMDRLEAKSVGEADIASLEASLAGLDEQYSELWVSDKAKAKVLFETKLDEAHGVLSARLEESISKLPNEWSAFDQARPLRSRIASIGQGRSDEKVRLNQLLDAKLASASDNMLSSVAEIFEPRSSGLRTLQALRTTLEERWQTVEPYIEQGGPGYTRLYQVIERAAESAFPEFLARTSSIVDESATFEERQSQYVEAARIYQRVVFSDPRFNSVFSRYADAIADLRPKPRTRDLVAQDGTPTSFGLKLATVSWVEQVWALTFQFLPFDASFVTESIRVNGLQKRSCQEEGAGGYWCSFQVQLGGALPFVNLLSLMPSRARFVWKGERWALVEVDESRQRVVSGPGAGGAPDELPCGLMLGCTAADIGANGVLAGLW